MPKKAPGAAETPQAKALLAAATVVLAMGCQTALDEPLPVALDYDDAFAPVRTYADDGGLLDPNPTDTDVTDTDVTDTDATDTDTDALDNRPVCDRHEWECCDDLRDWCSENEPDNWFDCAYGPTGCIPWGPPVPPKMPGAQA